MTICNHDYGLGQQQIKATCQQEVGPLFASPTQFSSDTQVKEELGFQSALYLFAVQEVATEPTLLDDIFICNKVSHIPEVLILANHTQQGHSTAVVEDGW